MALIVCTECGKRFSDKAACCPECGCPTAEVLKAAKKRTGIETKTGQDAAKTMLAEVEKARRQASTADSLFDSRSAAIQRKASQTIDLFGGGAPSRIVEIQFEARQACDDLYTTYQTLIGTLDAHCRPLLSENPGGDAIKAVSDLIRYLNDESEIENNFSASFNGSSLGNVASAKYVPSVANKGIQKFWEAQYSATPEAVAYQDKRKQAVEEAVRRKQEERKQEEERKRQETERKKKEQEKQDKLGAEYKEHMDLVSAECNAKVTAFSSKVNHELEAHMQMVKDELSLHVAGLQRDKNEIEHALSMLSAFQLKEKREKKKALEIIESKISRLTSQQVISAEYAASKKKANDAIQEYTAAIDSYLTNRFPNRGKDQKPYLKYQQNPSWSGEICPEPPPVDPIFNS